MIFSVNYQPDVYHKTALIILVGSRYKPFLCGLYNEIVRQIINDKYRELTGRKNLLNILNY
jgi:hypothetical protein